MVIDMAHYAILSDQYIVEQVIPGRDEGDLGVDWEQHYSAFFNKTVKRTSINTYQGAHSQGKSPFRLNYAGPGMRYDPALDGFIYPQPFPSWVLDPLKGIYNAPIAMPDDGGRYQWDESALSWVAI